MSSSTASTIAYKLVELVGMSLYWDNDAGDGSPSATVRDDQSETTHNYLLEPVSGKALLKRNTSAQPLRSLVSSYHMSLDYSYWMLAVG